MFPYKKLRPVLKVLWVASFIVPFVFLKLWVALVLVCLLLLSPSALVAVALTKRFSARLGRVKVTLLEGVIEGGIFMLLLVLVESVSHLDMTSIPAVALGVWLYVINQLNRAARAPEEATDELLSVPSFVVGVVVVFLVWLFALAPLVYGY